MKKTAVVTGGTRGIGYAIAKSLLEKNYQVAINYRTDKTKADEALAYLKKISPNVIAIQADITQQTARENILTQTLNTFGGIDLLVNNAGVSGKHGFLKESVEAFNLVIESNLTGPIFLAQLIANHMVDNKITGNIINIGSIASYSPTSGSLSYCAAKSGLLIATKNMAFQLGPHGIRVNSVTPGAIETDMSRHAWEDPTRGPAIEKGIPLRRRGQADEIAGAVLHLASDNASYTTGADIIVDGGWMLRTGSA